ncbi:unnamed protein product [Periconia digitata]|uniref:Zn(2)-C6 fungal-type domain-containing protein n=1 Tax=Periconia digitata TaxID=1303443 RepID=A0A9W4U4Q3_9PLEO|nr:unnamed protein product [Periconia digitata]
MIGCAAPALRPDRRRDRNQPMALNTPTDVSQQTTLYSVQRVNTMNSTSSFDAESTGLHSDGPEVRPTKRRKTRKGTHSCWACKKRKEKCIFQFPTSTACQGCVRRGTRCISQELPDDDDHDGSETPAGARNMRERLGRVEAALQQLIKSTDHPRAVDHDRLSLVSNTSQRASMERYHGTSANIDRQSHGLPELGGIPTPASIESERAPSRLAVSNVASEMRMSMPDSTGGHTQYLTHTSSHSSRHARLSQTLYKELPSHKDCELICKASHSSYYMLDEILSFQSRSHNHHQNHQPSPESILQRPQQHHHPVLIARYMLQLANILQQFCPDIDGEIQELSEPPQEMRDRLADLAISHVAVQDQLLGSIEGVQCVVLESMYHANCGNLRLSWAACRRSIYLAQMMGFHVADSRSQYQVLERRSESINPFYMWWRITNYDRTLSLLLGLPSGSSTGNPVADAAFVGDTPMERLERTHCVIAGRLVECKESVTKSHDLNLVQDLDRRMRVAARTVPNKWWLVPTLPNSPTSDRRLLFGDLKQLLIQMSHYHILNHIHLPFMLRSSSEESYGSSRMACVNASREILSRFVVLRRFKRIALRCRTQDFIALMAAVTLLLAHLDNHRRCSEPVGSSGTLNVLAHQYSTDRAMTEQVQECMEEINSHNSDAFCEESARLLRRLLAIDTETAELYAEGNDDLLMHDTLSMDHNERRPSDSTISINIAYFGVIKIARDGSITKEVPKPLTDPQPNPIQPVRSATTEISSADTPFSNPNAHTSMRTSSPKSAFATYSVSGYSAEESATSIGPQDESALFGTQGGTANGIHSEQPQPLPFEKANFDPSMPGLTAAADDWIFQGVDMAFFDSLMSGSNRESGLPEGIPSQ